ncbi:hypothetical protein BH09MYX1_BH09MYX1_10010 [soil metagenome]
MTSVMPGSFAESVALLPGDVVTAIAGKETVDIATLRAALRFGARTDEVIVDVTRDGVPHQAHGRAVRVEDETFAGGTVRYGALRRGGLLLRTITTVPESPGPHPLVVFFQGISCVSLDFAGRPVPPIGRILHELSARGLATLRLERRGLGDSEGPPCESIDFATEVADLIALTSSASSPLCFFGHSIGGMMLPLVARANPPRAAIAAGATRVRWSECMAGSTRRQLLLRGASDVEADAGAAAEAAAIARAAPNDVLFGRTGTFREQLQNACIADAYAELACPLLVVHGEHDWVASEDEARDLATLPDAELVVVPGMDHAFGHHVSCDESGGAYGQGTFEPLLVDRIESFVRRHS